MKRYRRKHEIVEAELVQPKKSDEHGPYYDVKWSKAHARYPRFIAAEEFERDLYEDETSFTKGSF